MARTAAPRTPAQLRAEAQEKVDDAIVRLERLTQVLKKVSKRLREIEKVTPAPPA